MLDLKLIEKFVPMLLLMVAKVPEEDKRQFAGMLMALCDAYLRGDQESIAKIVGNAPVSNSWKALIIQALQVEKITS